MSRPSVTVVMPFAGDRAEARNAIRALHELDLQPADQLILADNSGVAPVADGVKVMRAGSERSPAHARNVGAAGARGEWILFLDADCRAPHQLLDLYFATAVAPDVGALAGEIVAAPGGQTLAARYGAARSFLSQEAHLAHPYLPRAASANVMVRRSAFEQLGGFYEGVRAAEDTDFIWRLQQAGWRVELRADARVEHRYRATLTELRRQWRGYAAGRAWLGRRHEGFRAEPALRRALRRPGARPRRVASSSHSPGRLERGRYVALDAMLAAEELAGLLASNRPSRRAGSPAQVVLVADRFPVPGDPLADFARTLERARVEAEARPDVVDAVAAREVWIDYREDDGVWARWLALIRLAARHPVRCAVDLLHRSPAEPGLAALAPAAVRLGRDPDARLTAIGGGRSSASATRLAALTGRWVDQPGHH